MDKGAPAVGMILGILFGVAIHNKNGQRCTFQAGAQKLDAAVAIHNKNGQGLLLNHKFLKTA